MTINTEYFSGIAQELIGKINRVGQLVKRSNLKSGEYHEEIIRHFLRGFITKRYTLKTGYVYLNPETTSRQIDILLIDEHVPFTYMFKEGDFVVVRPEPVIAAIEIKTRLTRSEFKKAFENIVVAKKIKQKALGYYGHIWGAVFGFFSNKTIDNSVLDAWFKEIPVSGNSSDLGTLYPDEIFFFDNELTLSLHETEDGGERGNYFYSAMRPTNGSDYKALQLALLVGILFAACDSEDQRQRGMFSTFNIDTCMQSDIVRSGPERFSPGQGQWPEEQG